MGTYSTQEIKKLAKENLDFLGTLVAPEVVTSKFPPLYLAAFKLLTDALANNDDTKLEHILMGLPRGFAKSMLAKLVLLWAILFTQRKFILIVALSEALAKNVLHDVMEMLSHPNVIKVWGRWNVKATVNSGKEKEFDFLGRKIYFLAIGAGSAVRGSNRNLSRPDIIYCDDVQDIENAKSEVLSKQFLLWLQGTLFKSAEKNSVIIYTGNKYPYKGTALRVFEKSSHWVTFITGAIDANGHSIWEDVKPIDSLMAEFQRDLEAGTPEVFYAEVLNDDTQGLPGAIDLSAIPDPGIDYSVPPEGRFIILDLSAGALGSDNAVIMLCEVYLGVPVVMRVETMIADIKTFGEAALTMAVETNTNVIFYEGGSFQKTYGVTLGLIADTMNITGILYKEVRHGGKSKHHRIRNFFITPLLTGATVLHPTVQGVIHTQLRFYNPLKRDNIDDCIDVCAYIPQVMEEPDNLYLTYVHASVEGQLNSTLNVGDFIPETTNF